MAILCSSAIGVSDMNPARTTTGVIIPSQHLVHTVNLASMLNDNKESTSATSVLANTDALVHISGKHSRTSLLGLPCELRLRIYELVFNTAKRSTVNVYLGSEVCITNHWKMPSLALTCELITEESLPVLYQSVRYEFVFNGGKHDPNWVSKNDTMLNGLTFARHISNMGIVVHMHRWHVTKPERDEALEITAKQLCTLSEMLHPERTVAISRLLLCFPFEHKVEAVDPIYKGLGRLRMGQGFKLFYSKALPSEAMWQEFGARFNPECREMGSRGALRNVQCPLCLEHGQKLDAEPMTGLSHQLSEEDETAWQNAGCQSGARCLRFPRK
ncbi:hypothetical protein LTR17_014289 [Elasticomyces elasticus]|nr:hypothetical protein LTR17_014289 [Elasticomyces elasticus]